MKISKPVFSAVLGLQIAIIALTLGASRAHAADCSEWRDRQFQDGNCLVTEWTCADTGEGRVIRLCTDDGSGAPEPTAVANNDLEDRSSEINF